MSKKKENIFDRLGIVFIFIIGVSVGILALFSWLCLLLLDSILIPAYSIIWLITGKKVFWILSDNFKEFLQNKE